MRRRYQQALVRVLSGGQLILGREVTAFEREFARYCGARECVAVGNGTEALQIALKLSGVMAGQQQEVITTPLTASFTAHAIVAAGARPVFADVDSGTLLIDPALVSRAMNARTAALLPVHLYGQACDLKTLGKLARKSRVPLIQDAAQAHGTFYRDRPIAEYSDLSCYSFYPTQNLGALGDGGALVVNRAATAHSARLIRDGGRAGSHLARVEAVNSRLDELQAAFLRLHLAELERWNRRREELAALYDQLINALKIDEMQPIARAARSRSFFHLYVVRIAGKARRPRTRREALRTFLQSCGIETGIHYEHALHLHPAFRRFGYAPGDFPHAELAVQQVCSLPMHPFLSRRDVERVVRAVADFFRK